ncbi:hypothetical protein HDU84_001236 [Entophlyctis sp. JEL0112]|nr:hypothetical protein HDU84_001236 [Entophlyctis sp. JEL0112]
MASTAPSSSASATSLSPLSVPSSRKSLVPTRAAAAPSDIKAVRSFDPDHLPEEEIRRGQPLSQMRCLNEQPGVYETIEDSPA